MLDTTMQRTLPKRYAIRADQSLTLPNEVLTFLQWQMGDELELMLDLKAGTLTLTKVTNGSSGSNGSEHPAGESSVGKS